MRRAAALAVCLCLFAAPAHAQADSACTLRAVGHVPLSYDSVGRPMAPVTLGDRPKYLVIDTGGVYGMLDRATIRELGLDTRNGGTTIVGVTGASSDEYAFVRDFRAGDISEPFFYAMVTPGDEGETTDIRPVGTIAPDFLTRYDVELDFDHDAMNFFSPEHCPGQTAPFDAKMSAIPFQLDSGQHVIFPVMLDGKEITATLDTGSYTTILNLDVAKELFGVDTAASAEMHAVGRLTDAPGAIAYTRKFGTLSIAGITVTDPHVAIFPDLVKSATSRTDSGGLPALILGMTVLSRLHLYIAYRERILYVSEPD